MSTEKGDGDELEGFSPSPTANHDTPSPTFPPPHPTTTKKRESSKNYSQSEQKQNHCTEKQEITNFVE